MLRAALVAFCLTASASAQNVWTVSPQDNLLRPVDLATGNTIASVPMVDPSNTITIGNALALDETTSKLFAVVTFPGQMAQHLVTVDPTTGAATYVGDLLDRFAGLTFDLTGQMYGVTGDGATVPETLYLIEKNTAAKTLATALGAWPEASAISFPAFVPASLPPLDVYLQALIADPEMPARRSSTKPLAGHVR